jgi:hypothetical protein
MVMKTLALMVQDLQSCPSLLSMEFYELLIQFVLNLAVLLILSRALYYRYNRDTNHMFAQLISGLIVFLLCAMLRWVNLELTMAIGLFAIFAILRFRTLNVPVKEMAYLFMIVGISAINALLRVDECLQWIVMVNLVVIGLTWLLERLYFGHRLAGRTITFGKTDLLKPDMHARLLIELKDLTGLDVVRFEIGKVDYVKKLARIRIYFPDRTHTSFSDTEPERSDD